MNLVISNMITITYKFFSVSLCLLVIVILLPVFPDINSRTVIGYKLLSTRNFCINYVPVHFFDVLYKWHYYSNTPIRLTCILTLGPYIFTNNHPTMLIFFWNVKNTKSFSSRQEGHRFEMKSLIYFLRLST